MKSKNKGLYIEFSFYPFINHTLPIDVTIKFIILLNLIPLRGIVMFRKKNPHANLSYTIRARSQLSITITSPMTKRQQHADNTHCSAMIQQ